MRKYIVVFAAFFLVSFGFSGFVYAGKSSKIPDKLIMVTGVDKDASFLGSWLFLTYNEAFKRLGIELVYKKYPWKRCGLLANEGEVDGDLWRSPSYGDVYQNLVRVEETGPFGHFCAWAIDPAIKDLNGWNSLKGTEYKVDYVRGTKVCESELPKVVKKENLQASNRLSDSIRKLIFKRTDVLILIDTHFYDELKNQEIINSGIHKAGIMQSAPSHVYFHKKHKDLAPSLSVVLKQMKKEKLYEKYKNMAIEK
ncbi:hypothetical protein KKA14_21340 [bacterium]|nr:hypothetical protein [bacterium]